MSQETDQCSNRRLFLQRAVAGVFTGAFLAAAGEGCSATQKRDTAIAATAGPGEISAKPAMDVLGRLLPSHLARQVRLVSCAHQNQAESFRIAPGGDRLTIEGSSTSALLAGFNWYLNHVAHVNISWCGDSLDRLPERLPRPEHEIIRRTNARHRFAINDIDEAYTGAYRAWPEWEREIDVLALHGYNEVFMPVGAEAVYYKTFLEYGYSSSELRDWIPQPARLTFFLLQCMSSSPNPPSERLIMQRARLGRQIADRLRSLQITPVLSGYFGTVPPGFAQRARDAHPDVNVIPQGRWAGRNLRPDWLDPTTDAFAAVAENFYRNCDEILGLSQMYKMDFLHEGGDAGDVDVAAASCAVSSALQRARPGAIWAIMGWRKNPLPETLKAVDPAHLFVVDGLSDRHPPAEREIQSQFGRVPWAFGTIWNFGGHEKFGATVAHWNEAYSHWQGRQGSTLSGIALLPEASDNNPAAFAFFSDLAWRDGKRDLGQWFAQWARARYGGEDSHAAQAWEALLDSAYSMPPCDTGRPPGERHCWSQAHDGLFEVQPSLTAEKAYVHGPPYLRYDLARFAEALPHLIQVAPELRTSSAYRYDLMDVARQVLSNESRLLLPLLHQAHEENDHPRFDQLSRVWLQHIQLMDEVVATNAKTLLGSWLDEARAWGACERESDQLAFDNLSLITSWWWSKPPALTDYAHREWADLLGGYYRARWERYFDALRRARTDGSDPRQIDWTGFGHQWVRSHVDGKRLRSRPAGDIYILAMKVLESLKTAPYDTAIKTGAVPRAQRVRA